MRPTMYLRQVPITHYFGEGGQQQLRVSGYKLQQWWSETGRQEGEKYVGYGVVHEDFSGEWRDVEIVAGTQ